MSEIPKPKPKPENLGQPQINIEDLGLSEDQIKDKEAFAAFKNKFKDGDVNALRKAIKTHLGNEAESVELDLNGITELSSSVSQILARQKADSLKANRTAALANVPEESVDGATKLFEDLPPSHPLNTIISRHSSSEQAGNFVHHFLKLDPKIQQNLVKSLENLDPNDPRRKFSENILGELGVKDIAGSEHNPRVLTYLESTNVGKSAEKKDETAWCQALITWAAKEAGIKTYDGAEHQAAAYITLTVGDRVKKGALQTGDLRVSKRSGGMHVETAFVSADEDGEAVVTWIGGNQTPDSNSDSGKGESVNVTRSGKKRQREKFASIIQDQNFQMASVPTPRTEG